MAFLCFISEHVRSGWICLVSLLLHIPGQTWLLSLLPSTPFIHVSFSPRVSSSIHIPFFQLASQLVFDLLLHIDVLLQIDLLLDIEIL